MAKFIRIQSTVNITVTGPIDGVQMPDRNEFGGNVEKNGSWKVQERWSGRKVDIVQGVGYYPAGIVEWPSVQSLVNDGIITLGELCDTCPGQEKIEKEITDLKIYTAKTAEIKQQFAAAEPKPTTYAQPAYTTPVTPTVAAGPVVEEAKVETVAEAPKSFSDLLKQVQETEKI